MKQIIFAALCIVCLATITQAQTNFKLSGYCEQGGHPVTTVGLISTTQVQQSYPSCQITVFQAGTSNLATIFSDGSGTPKSNPFTASSTGYWNFYVPASTLYDVRLSGGGISAPFTLSDLVSPGAGTGGGVAIGGTVTGGTAGSVPFVATGPVLAQDNTNLFWDNTVKLLKTPISDKGGQVFDVTAYGAVGDYNPTTATGTDNTTAIQAAITAAQAVNGRVYIPAGNYKITGELVISNAVTIEGAGIHPLYGSIDDDTQQSATYIPIRAPYLIGSIITQVTAATNAIRITAQGRAVNLHDFGIKFANAIAFRNTGHGIYTIPPNMSDGKPDWGVISARWDNIKVWGHDGNHYAFSLTNPSLMTLVHLEGWGGGGLEIYANTNITAPGNLTDIQSYFALVAGGTAHGYFLHKSGATPGVNLSSFIRPQCNVTQPPTIYSTPFPGIAATTTAQKIFNDNGGTPYLSIIQPDFESNQGSGTVITTTAGGFYMTPGFIQDVGTDLYTPYFSSKSDGIRVRLSGGATAIDLLQSSGNSFFDGQGIFFFRETGTSFYRASIKNDGFRVLDFTGGSQLELLQDTVDTYINYNGILNFRVLPGLPGNSRAKLTNAGDFALTVQGQGVVLRDTDGAGCHRVTVNTAGTISAASVTCP
jgi:hypothetical protein